MGDAKKKKKGGDGTTLAYNLQKHFFNRRRLESRRIIKKNVPSCFSLGEGKQVLNEEENSIIDCVMNCPSGEIRGMSKGVHVILRYKGTLNQ